MSTKLPVLDLSAIDNTSNTYMSKSARCNVPGMRVRSDQWLYTSREGFGKNQVLEQERGGDIITTQYHKTTNSQPIPTPKHENLLINPPKSSPRRGRKSPRPVPTSFIGNTTRPVGEKAR